MAYMKMKAIKRTPKRTLDYILNEKKLGEAKQSYSHHVNQELADLEFSLIRDECLNKNPKLSMSTKENLAYHVIQSYKPGEKVSPEMALEIAKRTMREFTNDDYAYVIAIHTDEVHLHAHIVVNAYSHTGKMKLKNHRSIDQLIEISNRHCLAHGLSTSELKYGSDKRNNSQTYSKKDSKKGKEQQLSKYPETAREVLKKLIDQLVKQATTYDEFLDLFKKNGVQVEVRGSKVADKQTLAFLLPHQQRFIKLSSLKEGYSLDEIKARITNEKLAPGEQIEMTHLQELQETLRSPRLEKSNKENLHPPQKPRGFKYYSDTYWRLRCEDFKSIDLHGDVLSLINRYGFTSSRDVQSLIDEFLSQQSVIKAKTTRLEAKYDKLVETYKKESTSLEEKEKIKAEIPLIRQEIKPLNVEFQENLNQLKQFEVVKARFLQLEKTEQMEQIKQNNQRRR